MAKKKRKPTGEQLDLIDVQPKNAKQLIAAARAYKRAQTARREALEEEVAQKQKVLALIKEADLQPVEGGVIKFRCDGLTISVTPRDELLKVKDESDKD